MAATAAIFIVPKLIGYDTFVVLSGSMEPKYHVGSMVFVKPVSAEEIKVGDAISFKIAGKDVEVATHRVIAVDSAKKEFSTKGDANETADVEPVSFDRLIGRASDFSVPEIGYLSVFIRTKQGILVACAALILIILLIFLPEIFKKDPPKPEKQVLQAAEPNGITELDEPIASPETEQTEQSQS